ncbi:outer membrane protein OmpK [uncultured Ferrimonas sp.]|uniref:nucleoside-specific channel-forming Tsx family protein n=1 Tax=uncultured Ferrimonas sp. TaxID=432640 RepID=UPI00262974E3|nr:outer membrane protein OmpK [uncultured Ferrimonas sp.]
MMKKLAAAAVLAALSTGAMAADYSDGDIHKGDYKWMQFNLMQSVDARIPFGSQDTTYLEMEFGGRSGIFDLYGYVDYFDVLGLSGDDRDGSDNMFMKLAPRMSLDALTGKDLSFGPVQEVYLANVTNVGDGALVDTYWGVGSDVMVPWLGKVGLNAYARYVDENYGGANENKWDGYMISTNWFKPFMFFKNDSFLSYQGYTDYKFGADEVDGNGVNAKESLESFHGIYWHSDRFAAGYGLKYFYNMALVEDGGAGGDTTGFGHYFAVTYKF